MWNPFKKKVKNLGREIQKMERKDLMEATVGIAVLVMYADGNASDVERDKVRKVLDNTPTLANFGAEVQATFQRFDAIFKDVGFIAGRQQVLRELGDVKGDQFEMEDVLVTGVTIALADGSIDEKEMDILQRVAQGFGLRLENFLS